MGQSKPRARRYGSANQILQSTGCCDWSRSGGALGRLIWDPPTRHDPHPPVASGGHRSTQSRRRTGGLLVIVGAEAFSYTEISDLSPRGHASGRFSVDLDVDPPVDPRGEIVRVRLLLVRRPPLKLWSLC